MRVRWIAAALTLALCFSLAACGHPPVSEEQEEELPTLRIGSDDYELYSYLDETGEFTGIDVDLAGRPAAAWAIGRSFTRWFGKTKTRSWPRGTSTACGAALP